MRRLYKTCQLPFTWTLTTPQPSITEHVWYALLILDKQSETSVYLCSWITLPIMSLHTSIEASPMPSWIGEDRIVLCLDINYLFPEHMHKRVIVAI